MFRAIGRRTLLQGAGAALSGAFPSNACAAAPNYPDRRALQEAHEKGPVVPVNKTYRMMEWECHTPPEGNFDINLDHALKAARDAGAESMMFYSQDHWGYSFYPSDVAVRHPHLENDFFGREVSIARKLGMSVVCYYSLQFNNQSVLTHPDWGWVNDKGEQQKMRWLITCLDTPYRAYVLGMMNELFSRYELDELFLDIFGIQFHAFHSRGQDPFCYCQHTVKAWEHDHPGDPYREGFQSRQGWDARYQWHQKRSMSDMLDEIVGAVRKHRPQTLISLNGGPEAFPNDVMQRVSFIYAEPLTSETGISLGSILMRGWGRPDYQAGVFSRQGYQDTYAGQLPRVKADALILQNARVFIVGNAPVIGGLDGEGFSKRWFDVARETWEDVRNVDGLLSGVEPLLSTAVLYSEPTLQELAGQKRPQDFRSSVLGALETMTFSGRPVESLPEFRLRPEELRKYELLVLPEVEVLDATQADVIRDWVGNGGTLIASGNCGLVGENHALRKNFPLADVLGADFEAIERKYAYDPEGHFKKGVIQTYLESTGHPLTKSLSESTVGLSGAFLRLRMRPGAQELLRYRLPLMVEDLPHYKWFNWGAPPPGRESGGTAAVLNRFHKGQSVYVGAPLFQAVTNDKLFWTRKWIPSLVRELVKDPVAELHFPTLPEYLHGTFFWDKSRRFVLVQILNAVELGTQAEFIDVPSAEIRINPEKLNVKGARAVWPSERPLEISHERGRLTISVPKPGRYTALYLSLA
ncbi:MAG: alpha-L-fucosidase [Acidobacteriaceae bacterium]|nr:alpha-L-fucosidase [Acidobacteriaceae bacterium]